MAIKSITGAWRACSSLAQTGFGAAQAADTRLPFEGDLMEAVPDLEFLNTKEMGQILPNKHRIVTRKLDHKHKGKAFPSLVALFASQAMGACATAASGGAFKHTLTMDSTVVELAKRSFVEFDGNGQFLYQDIACVGFTLSGKRNDFLDFEADLVGSGAETVGDTTAEVAESAESYLVFNDVSLTKGGTIAGSVVTGGASLNADLVDFKLVMKNNGKGVHLAGDASGNYGSIRRGEIFEMDFEANIEIEDQSHHTDLFAGNEFILHLPIVGGVAAGAVHYGIDVILPRTAYRSAAKKNDAGIVGVNLKAAVLFDATNGGPQIIVTNLHSKSYLATV